MNSSLELSAVAPFSPTILKGRMPDNLVEALNSRLDAISASTPEISRRDWSQNLAGKVSREIRITDLVHETPELRDLLYDVSRTFAYRCDNSLLHYTDYKETEELKDKKLKVEIKEAWANDMVAGDYNPVHYHQGCTFSWVGFLRLPADFETEFNSDKSHQNTTGCLQFIDSRTAVGLRNLFTVKPVVGEFYLWPSWMLHCVYPFTSAGIRRSVAANIALM